VDTELSSILRGTHGAEKMAEVLGVARSGYYSWIGGGQSARAVEEKELVEQIQHIQGEGGQRYGSPRMREELLRRGRHVGKKRVARIMRENALGARQKRRFVLTTRSEKGQEVAENCWTGTSKPPRSTACGYLTLPTLRRSKGGCICVPCLTCTPVGWWAGR